MERRIKIIAAGAGAVLALGGLGATAVGARVADDDQPITGEALERATDAALAFTGEGRVTETEVGDEESLYEIEVTLDDGSQVDVQLDENFEVVGSESDDDGGHDDADGDD